MKTLIERKEFYLELASVSQLAGLPKSAALYFSKACEIHLKLSDKEKKQ